ncbi:MAG TPA: UvrD-helicase domain-containing protein, partial [Acidimicrobiales bacterium]|nr:UvrD-helicase domain-containing protein [Acidimicrobiales bacterium]
QERGGTFQSYTERDIRVRTSLNRLEKLELGREALIFGRIDRRADGQPLGSQESFHIGRLALSDQYHEPLVVDWRAPIAEPFYRATGAHPMGLRRRRHFMAEGRRLLDLEDELFGPDIPDGTAGPLGLSGPSVLMAALERAHTGRMRDIVATVQAEQDEIIRAPLAGALVVQGGPGTGKTAVALHRAAYLLYTFRFPLESQGVLVIGPNPTFLRYIDQVLPSLGETGAELTTVLSLYKGARPGADEPAELARLKGDPRMASVLRRAVRQRQRRLRRATELAHGRTALTLSPAESQGIVEAVQRRPGPHNTRRGLVESMLWQHFASQLEEKLARRAPGQLDGADEAQGLGDLAQLGAALRRRPEVAELLERMWPRLSAEDLLHDLLGARPLIEQAARGILGPGEMALLHRPRSRSSQEVAWTPADIALLDEAAWLLGPVHGRREGRKESRSAEKQQRTYGHIVVDEAQDLTPMQLRMVARRSLSGSMTLVGDIAQATGAWAPASWDDVMAHLPARRGWSRATLSVSYRAPAEVMELASHVLAAALPGNLPPDPVRRTGHQPRLVPASGHLAAAVSQVVQEEAAAVAGTDGGEDGSVGVLSPPELVNDLGAALRAAGVEPGLVGAGALDAPVTLLAVGDAKGLEFDAVVVVEPSRVVAGGPQGLRALYVALTRCTRRLAVVYQELLPAPLRS